MAKPVPENRLPRGPATVGARSATAPDRLDIPFGDPLVHRLFPPLATGVHWGLERTRSALADLGDPHDRYPSIHVGGTNGKGSVVATVHAVLSRSGVRTGLYTSPHLCSFTERFQVGRGPVDEGTLIRYADEIRDVVVGRGLTFFEAITVLAFHLLAREGVEVAAVEVGLGGRLDATNVLTPVVSAVTNVALDHAEFLGDTLGAIAVEKAGIVKPGVPFFTAASEPELMAVFRGAAHERGAPFHALHPTDDVRDVEVDRDHTTFTVDTGAWGTLRLRTPLVGPHQAVNGALAVRLLDGLPEELRPSREAVVEGVAGVVWPGRDQLERVDGISWLLDVAHNTAGVHSLVETLDRLDLPRPRVALVAVQGDKEWRAMLPPLFRRCDTAILTQAPTAPVARRWDPGEVAREVAGPDSGPGVGPVRVEEDFQRAFDLAAAAARGGAGSGTVVVTGSVHTVGAALRRLDRVPWGERG